MSRRGAGCSPIQPVAQVDGAAIGRSPDQNAARDRSLATCTPSAATVLQQAFISDLPPPLGRRHQIAEIPALAIGVGQLLKRPLMQAVKIAGMARIATPLDRRRRRQHQPLDAPFGGFDRGTQRSVAATDDDHISGLCGRLVGSHGRSSASGRARNWRRRIAWAAVIWRRMAASAPASSRTRSAVRTASCSTTALSARVA